MIQALSGGVGALHIKEGPKTDLQDKKDVADIERFE